MKSRREVIIIGGGLGGLASAAYLAKNGFKIKLFEKLPKVGGVIDTFERKGYWFEATTHQIAGYEYFKKVYKLLEIKGDLDLIRHEHLYDVVYVENESITNRYTLPSGINRLRQRLIEYFPGEEKNIAHYLETIIGIGSDVSRLRSLSLTGNVIPVLFDKLAAWMLKYAKDGSIMKALGKRSYPNLVKFSRVSYADLTASFSPLLQSILSQYRYYLSTNANEASGLFMAAVYNLYITQSPLSFRRGTKKLIDDLVRTIGTYGGEIFQNLGVVKISVENNRATGVIAADGRTYRSEYVISDINTHDTFISMIGEDTLPNGFIDKIKNLKNSISVFQIYIGLPGPYEQYGFNVDAETSFFNFSYDTNDIGDTLLPSANSNFIMTNYSALNKELSHQNKTSVVIVESDDYGRWKNLSDNEYKKLKLATQDLILDKVEKITKVKIKKHAEVLFSATPRTYRHYMSNPAGEMIGPRFTVDQTLSKRTSNETPIENLFLAGAYTQPGGGISSVLTGGIATAGILMEKMKSKKS